MEHPATAAKFQKRGRYNFSAVTLAGGHVQPHELGHSTSGSRRPAGPVSVAMRPFQAVSATAALATRVGPAGPGRGAGWDAPHPEPARPPGLSAPGAAARSAPGSPAALSNPSYPRAGREPGLRVPTRGGRRENGARGSLTPSTPQAGEGSARAAGEGRKGWGRARGEGEREGEGRARRASPPPPPRGSPALGVRSRRCLRPDSRGGWKGQGRHDLG